MNPTNTKTYTASPDLIELLKELKKESKNYGGSARRLAEKAKQEDQPQDYAWEQCRASYAGGQLNILTLLLHELKN